MSVEAPRPMQIVRIGKDYVASDGGRISVYSRVRGFDIGLGGFKIAVGLGYLLTGRQIHVGTEGSITADWPTWVWIALLIGLGALRWAALIVNGRYRQGWSALVRAGAAAFGALFWAGIATYSLAIASVPNVLLFSALSAAEIYCTIRAGREAVLIWKVSAMNLGADADGPAL